MCDWCERDTDEKRKRLRDHGDSVALIFERMAVYYRGLGLGGIKPHGEEAAGLRIKARVLIRLLVEEWL